MSRGDNEVSSEIVVSSGAASSEEKSLQRWLRKRVVEIPSVLGEQPCRLITLMRLGSGGSIVLEHWTIKKDENLSDLAAAIWQVATETANSKEKSIDVAVTAHFGDSSQPKHGTWERVVHGYIREDAELSESLVSEASPKGLLAVAMKAMSDKDKISNVFVLGLFRNMQQNLERAENTIEHQQETIERLNAEREVMIRRFEETLSLEQERKIAMTRAINDMEMQGRMLDMGLQLAPIVANKIAGKKLLPEPVNAKLVAMKEFFGGLTQEKLMSILSTLNDAERIVVLEMIRDFGEEDAAEKTKKENAAKAKWAEAERKAKESALAVDPKAVYSGASALPEKSAS